MKKLFFLAVVLLGFGAQSFGQCNSPKINSFTPNTGFIGSTVTIFGANFDVNPSNNQVFFGATEAEVISASFGKLEVVVPTGATLAPISVRNACNKIAYSSTPFNGIFCPTPLTSTTYNSSDFIMSAKGAYNMLAYDMDLDGKPDVISGGVSAGGFTIAHNKSTPGNLNFSRFDINVTVEDTTLNDNSIAIDVSEYGGTVELSTSVDNDSVRLNFTGDLPTQGLQITPTGNICDCPPGYAVTGYRAGGGGILDYFDLK